MLRLNRYIPLFIFLSIGNMHAQDKTYEVPTTNSHAKVQQRVANTDIEVSYNRPSMKGRTIFGELVPFGKVWRTGSDASTKITFSTPVFINAKPLAAGTYELFTIPDKNEWTVIFQQNQNQWGSYKYSKEFDVIRVKTEAKTSSNEVETFNVNFGDVTSNSTIMQLSWENTLVAMKIGIDLKQTVLPKLESSLREEGPKPYFRAAMFYFENDLDISRASELMELALKDNPGHIGMLYRQSLIFEKKGDINEAIKAARLSLKNAQNVSGELNEEYTKLNTALLNRLKN